MKLDIDVLIRVIDDLSTTLKENGDNISPQEILVKIRKIENILQDYDESEDRIYICGNKGARNDAFYAALPRNKKYKVMSETCEMYDLTEYFIIGPEGVLAEGYYSPEGAIAEALAVIPGITIDDIEM